MENRVQVLLSTYNGEKFINEQLQSLYAQEGVEVALLVRDDGSTDSTCAILAAEQAAGRLSWYTGENLKPAFSFWNLLQRAPEMPYYAFCDQDDVWDGDKLKAAVGMLSAAGDAPALYFSQTRLVDASLKEIGNVKISPLLTFGEALSYQFVTGCTMVMNASMRNILLKYTPTFIRMHDVWIYDVAQAVGARLFFDAQPHISYRQHGGNAVGQERFLKQWKRRLVRTAKSECIRSRLAQELLKGYSALMPAENLALATMVAGYKENFSGWMRLLFTGKMRCAPLGINISSKLAILLRKF